jgi:O-antigen/teichoic acid export membrane protein
MRLPPAELVARLPFSAPVVPPVVPVGSTGRLARNLVVLGSGQLVTWSLTALWTVFVPNRVGPSGMGEIGVATALANVVAIVLALGVGPLLVKEIAREHLRAPGLVGSALILRFLLLPIGVAVTPLYVILTHAGTELTMVIWLSVGATLISLLATPLIFALQGFERLQFSAYSNMLTSGAVAIGGVGLVLAGYGVIPLMWLALIVSAVTACLAFFWIRPYFRIDWRPNFSRIQFLAVSSLPYWASGLVLTFYMWIDLLMLARMTPIDVVGWYNVPTRLFATLLVVPTILSSALLPRMSRAFRHGDDALRDQARPALEMTLVLSLPIAIGTALVSRQAIWVLYGYQFLPAIPVLSVLALCLPSTYLNTMANQVLIASNRQVAWTKVMVGAAIANPVANYLLIQLTQSRWHNGAVGAAFALLATELGMSVAAIILLPRVLTARSWRRILRAAAATLGMGVAVGAVSLHSGIAVQIATGLVSFSALALLFGVVSREEIAELRHLPASLRRR